MNYGNTNRGRIWSNECKDKDTHPDFKGSLNVEGEEFWISAWKQKGDANSDTLNLSFSVRPKDETMIEAAKDYVVDTGNQARDWL
jgi:hypothetical protein